MRGTKTARHNLERAFPDKSSDEIECIIQDMWDNLGRTIAEYPHLEALGDTSSSGRTELVGRQHLDTLRDDGIGGIVVGAHLGNWEVPSFTSSTLGLEMGLVYRAPNNPYVARLLMRLRRGASGVHIPKGTDGARMLIRHLSKGGHVGILNDQKMNDGIAVPFFGRNAMTAPARLITTRRLSIRPAAVQPQPLTGSLTDPAFQQSIVLGQHVPGVLILVSSVGML
jgi:KDO2-lipid IV(A) lauroyltransferase